jgi:HK97 family phage major capsid protein
MKRHFVKQDQETGGVAAAGGAAIDQNALRAESAQAERLRASEIDALCQAHNVDAEVRRGLIQKGNTVAEARGIVLDMVLARSKQTQTASLGDGYAPDMTEKEKGRYSMLRAINAAVSGDWKAAGFEAEVSAEIGKRMGKSTNGFFMPTNIPFGQRAAYAVGASATGGATVATNLLAGSFIEALRNKCRVMQLGATTLSGLVGNVDIPRQVGTSSTFWVTEGTALTEAEATFDKVSLAIKHIGTYSQISRSMLMQGTPDIEMIARADLITQIALGIDLAALSGSGASGQPLGIANTSGIGSVIGGTNGAAITIDHLIDLETSIATANADVDNMAYIANAKTIGALKKLKSSTGQYLWTNNPLGQRSATPGEINGYGVARTNQARGNLTKGTAAGICSEVFMGNFSELLVGEWGVLELMPNPYDSTAYKAGAVLLRAMQSLDIGVRHAASFAMMSDAL